MIKMVPIQHCPSYLEELWCFAACMLINQESVGLFRNKNNLAIVTGRKILNVQHFIYHNFGRTFCCVVTKKPKCTYQQRAKWKWQQRSYESIHNRVRAIMIFNQYFKLVVLIRNLPKSNLIQANMHDASWLFKNQNLTRIHLHQPKYYLVSVHIRRAYPM